MSSPKKRQPRALSRSSSRLHDGRWGPTTRRATEWIRPIQIHPRVRAAVSEDVSRRGSNIVSSLPKPSLQLQALVEHFDAECRQRSRLGLVVVDTSNHQLDQHASKCVSSFVVSRKLGLHPVVYYAGSKSCEAIQVADLMAAIRRRAVEGDANMLAVASQMAVIGPSGAVVPTFAGRAFSSQIDLFS